MDDKNPAFEGWAILELMGHRRLAGWVSEQSVGGCSFIRIDIPGLCPTYGVAKWCPEHGNCLCQGDLYQNPPGCPLHDPESKHGEKYLATQFYSPQAVYCLTPTTEEIARTVAKQSRPQPVARWEIERPALTSPASEEPY